MKKKLKSKKSKQRKTKNKSKQKKTKQRAVKKTSLIKDPPFSDELNQGSDATEGLIQYHYQYYTNITDYIEYLCDSSKLLMKRICLLKDPINCTLLLDQKDLKKGIQLKYSSQSDFVSFIQDCISDKKVRFIPIILETVKKNMNHANIIVIDVRKKQIELFEPHGNRSDDSTLHNIKKSYSIKKTHLKKFFKTILDYKFISVVDELKKHSLQGKYDANSGYCITWSLLYFHYKVLNPSVSYKKLIHYIDKKINLEKLLQYAKHVEETLKSI